MTEVIEKTEYKKGYKKTKLGWIPEDWEVILAGDISSVVTGGTPSKVKPEYWNNGNINWMNSSEVNKKYIYEVENKITKIGLDNSNTKILPINTIMIALNGQGKTRGTVAILKIESCCNQSLAGFICKEGTNYQFLFFFLQNMYDDLRNITGDGSRTGLNLNILRKLKIILPPLKEQEKIAEILSAWDDGIETLEKLIERKEILKKSLSQKYFQRKNSIFQLKPHKLGELFKNRKETNCCDLELLSVCEGLGIVPRSQLNAKDNSNENKSKYLKVCIGDLAYNTMRMWQGRCGVSSYEGIVSPAYTVCIPKNNIDVDYMYYLFKTPHMIHDFWRYSQGIVDDTLNLKFNNFEIIKVLIPDKETQTKIAKLLKSYDKEIQLLNSKLEKLKEQKKGLMQKLLTGQIRVKI